MREWQYDMWHEDYLISELPGDDETQDEVAFLVDLLHIGADTRALDIACGVGRHARLLAEVGARVVGVDSSQFLLDEAARRSTNQRVSYIQGDMRALPFEGQFDVAVCLFASFGLLGDAGNLAALAAMADSLSLCGRLVIESWNPLVAADLDGRRNWWRAENRVYLAWAEHDSVAGVVHDHREVIDLATGAASGWTRTTRFYSPPEITVLARAVGLRPVRWFGDFDGSPHSASAPRMIVLLEKAGA